jgi:hypothetical protein
VYECSEIAGCPHWNNNKLSKTFFENISADSKPTGLDLNIKQNKHIKISPETVLCRIFQQHVSLP